MNDYPVFVKVSKSIEGIKYMKNIDTITHTEICFSYCPAADFQQELEYQIVETGEIKKYKPFDHVSKEGFIIFVSEKTYKELDIKRQFYVHYIVRDEKSKWNGWRADKGLSDDSKNELIRITMEKYECHQ